MDFANVVCPACRKQVVEPINLICSHHLCYECASKIIISNAQSFEKKYKIVCPACRKTTITYDLRHLIISQTQYDEDLFVTTKYLNEKSEVQPKSPGYSKSNDDIESLIAKYQQNKKSVSISKQKPQQHYPSCPSHPSSYLKYYCESDKSLLCIDCLRYHKDHHLGEIQTFQDLITSDAGRLKQELKNRLNEMKKGILAGNDQKKTLLQELDSLQKGLDHDFGVLKLEVERKYQELSRKIKEIYCAKIEEQTLYLDELAESIKFLKEFVTFPITDLNSHIKFYSTSSLKLKNLKLDIPPSPKTTGYVWDKDIEGIEEGLQRFMKLKEVTLTSHNRHKSGNHSNVNHNISSIVEISRKGSFAEDDLVSRASINRNRESKALDIKKFKF